MGSKFEKVLLGIVAGTISGILVFYFQKYNTEDMNAYNNTPEIIYTTSNTTQNTAVSEPVSSPEKVKEKEATYLKVNDKSQLNVSFEVRGEVETFYISTDGEDYNITYLPSWCTVKKSTTSFTLTCEPNSSTSNREDWFRVNSGNQSVKITINQKGKEIVSSSVTIDEKAGQTTYLEVDGKTNLTKSFGASGGSETLYISTDGDDYDISGLPSWCTVKKSSGSFTLKCKSNTNTSARDDWFNVTSGDKKVKITVKQKGEEAKPTKTTICYQGDAYGCILSITITIAGQTYTPYGNSFTIEGLPKGKQKYTIQGTIACPTIGSCVGYGTGYINIQQNSTFYVLWQNTNYGACSISLSD